MLEVEYVFNNKRYKALFPYDPNRQSNFLKCEADGEDFSEEMEKMLGPDETMHRQKVTPEMIGKQSVEVVYSDFLAVENNFQSQKKFGRNDVISIS
jgi:hypothetical protein